MAKRGSAQQVIYFLKELNHVGCINKRKNTGKYHHSYKGYNDISGQFWKQIKISALSRNLDFQISIEYIWNLFLQQNKKCVLSGLPLEIAKSYADKKKTTASLDRIDSSKGYIER